MGKMAFRALGWSPEANPKEILALSSPRWVIIKNILPFLWKFIPQIVKPFGKFIRMDESPHLVLHLDANVLISILPGVNLPNSLHLNIVEDSFSYPLEFLGGLNACFLCKNEGHVRKNCPILRKRASIANATKPNPIPNGYFVQTAQHTAESTPTIRPEPSIPASNPLLPPSNTTPPLHPSDATSPILLDDGYQVVMKSKKSRRKNAQQMDLDKVRASSNPPLVIVSHTPSNVKSIISSFETPLRCFGSIVMGDGSANVSEKIDSILCNNSGNGSTRGMSLNSAMAQVISVDTSVVRNSAFCSPSMLSSQGPRSEANFLPIELEEPLPRSICLEEDAPRDDLDVQIDGIPKPNRRGRPMGYKNKANSAKKKDKGSPACDNSLLAAEGP